MHGLSPEEWTNLLLSVNTHRTNRRLTPYQVAEHVKRALGSTDLERLSQDLGFSDTTTLSKLNKLSQLPNGLAAVISWGGSTGTISMSTASELMRLGDHIEEAIPLAISNSITRNEARQIVQLHQRSKQPLAECVSQSLLTRPRVERQELILGTLVTPQARENAQKLGNEAAGRLLARRLAKFSPDIFPKSVRINEDRFSLLMTTADSERLRKQIAPITVEQKVSDLIGQIMS